VKKKRKKNQERKRLGSTHLINGSDRPYLNQSESSNPEASLIDQEPIRAIEIAAGNRIKEADPYSPVLIPKVMEEIQEKKAENDTRAPRRIYSQREPDKQPVADSRDAFVRIEEKPNGELEKASKGSLYVLTEPGNLESSDNIEVDVKDAIIYKQGDIVYVNYPLPNNSLKPHYAIVVSSDEVFTNESGYLTVMITSQHINDCFTLLLPRGATTEDKIKGQARCHLINFFGQAEIQVKVGELKKKYLIALLKKIKQEVFKIEGTLGTTIEV
jgi:hypothetical protein